MIYQKHAEHGYHIALNQGEAAYNNTKGWKTVTEAEFYDRPEKLSPDVAAITSDLEAKYEQTFGKRPHHRMKPETIAARLQEDTP